MQAAERAAAQDFAHQLDPLVPEFSWAWAIALTLTLFGAGGLILSSIGAAKGAGLPQKLFGLAPPHNCPRTLADLRGLLLDREKLLTALNDDPKACREASRFDASQEDKHCGVSVP